jgi:glycosyltransferase involved in cell wall biosynthesis
VTSISVAMCTFDGARFLREQLASIAAQARLPDELVVVDDGSTDDTMAILEAFRAEAPFPVRVHRNERNLGSTKNFEVALGRCGGDVLVLCDQDDVWTPAWLEAVESTFEQRPEVGLVFTDADLIDEHGDELGRTLWQQLRLGPSELDLLRSPEAVDLLVSGWTVTGATMAFRSAFRPLVLPIPGDLPMLHDGWIAVLVAAASAVLPLRTPLVRYRQHAGQQNGAKGAPIDDATDEARRRAQVWGHLLLVGGRVHERLAEQQGAFAVGAAADRIAGRLAHARFRSALPARRVARLPGAARELVAGRYHRYGNGLRSAAKDVVLGG